MDGSLTILQVNGFDTGGGAEKFVRTLCQRHSEAGHQTYLAVAKKRGNDPRVLQISHGRWPAALNAIADRINRTKLRGSTRAAEAIDFLAQPGNVRRTRQGMDVPVYADSAGILELPPVRPDILHFQNLHGFFHGVSGYFDLRAWPRLSHELPVFITMHDAWLLSGHCAHSFECERWKTGCGACPDLNLYPRVRRDRTAENWKLRRDIYAASKLYVATPSQWLMDRVHRSMLAAGAAETRVINNGVDTRIFTPAEQAAAREGLGIPGLSARTKVLLITANGLRQNPFKDFRTLQTALEMLGAKPDCGDLVLLALGERGKEERIGNARLCFVPFEDDPQRVARFYQAADVYVHTARADTFPTTVLEALACGIPVIGSNVGGIPEQLRPLRRGDGDPVTHVDADQATGMLVKVGDAQDLAAAIELLLRQDALRQRLGSNAAADALARFDEKRQSQIYLDWYLSTIEAWKK